MRGCGLTLERLSSGAVRIALRGELDLNHAYTFDEELRRIEQDRPPCIVLDLRELHFMDSCGLGRLVAARRRARRSGTRLVLVRGGRAVQQLLALTGLEESFEIVGDVPSSLRLAEAPQVPRSAGQPVRADTSASARSLGTQAAAPSRRARAG